MINERRYFTLYKIVCDVAWAAEISHSLFCLRTETPFEAQINDVVCWWRALIMMELGKNAVH